MPDRPEPFELCPRCRQTNGGLRYTRHRQIHLEVGDQQACIDQGLAGLMPLLWKVCQTYGCCEDDGGRAYVDPSAETVDAAEAALRDLGLSVERSPAGRLSFARPAPPPVVDETGNTGHTTISAVRDAVAAAAGQLARDTVGIDHVLIVEARDRLTAAQRELTNAMTASADFTAGRTVPGFLIRVVLFAASCWLFAWTGAAVFDGSPTATIVGGVLGYGVAVVVGERVAARTRQIGLRRLPPPRPVAPDEAPSLLLPADHRIARVGTSIAAARQAAAGAATGRLSRRRSYPGSAGAFARRRENDAVVGLLAAADVSLALAGATIQAWLDERRG